MLKHLFNFLLLIAAAAYLVFAVVRYSRAENLLPCKALQVTVIDSLHATLISAAGIENALRQEGMHPVGVRMRDINPLLLERTLERDSFIRRAVCTVTPGERVRILVEQRIPMLRVMDDKGGNYYIDEEGTFMKAEGYEANLAVATGTIPPDFAKRELLALGAYLRAHEFWDEQVEQIVVRPNREVDLIMRVGDQVVHFGRIERVEEKFANLRAFYSTIMPQVGWHKYSEISVAYEGRVIARKRQTINNRKK